MRIQRTALIATTLFVLLAFPVTALAADVEATVDRVAVITGAHTVEVSGTVTCLADGQVNVAVSLKQQKGKKAGTNGMSIDEGYAACTAGQTLTFSRTVLGYDDQPPWYRGPATVEVYAEHCTEGQCTDFFDLVTVQKIRLVD